MQQISQFLFVIFSNLSAGTVEKGRNVVNIFTEQPISSAFYQFCLASL